MRGHPGLKAALIVAVAGMFVVIVSWLVTFHDVPIASDSRRWSEFGAYLGGTLAPILAFASFLGLIVTIQAQGEARRNEEDRKDSAVYLDHATKSLERAFETFMGTNDAEVPVSDRLVWLTVARLLLSAKSMAGKIRVESMREMYEAEEEHWRRRFYEVVRPDDVRSPLVDANYFREGEEVLGYVIDERSIRIIYEFTAWPEGQQDPIDQVERYSEEELANMRHGMRGVKDFIESRRRAN